MRQIDRDCVSSTETGHSPTEHTLKLARGARTHPRSHLARQRLQLRLPCQLRRGHRPRWSTTYKDKATLERDGLVYIRPGADAFGVSVFLREGDSVLHTYSTYGRGVDQLIGTYSYLDLTPWGGSCMSASSSITTRTTQARDRRGVAGQVAAHGCPRRSRAGIAASLRPGGHSAGGGSGL
jgi:predicted dithiol-disulfide oxidoreductase (DUF899 family)